MNRKMLACLLTMSIMTTVMSCRTVNAALDENYVSGDALIPNIMQEKVVEQNPFMGSLDASIHNDSYGTDVVSSVAPLGIYPEVSYGMEPDSLNATPNAYYDDNGRAVTAYLGGVAIKELSRDRVEVLGSFIPSRDEAIPYAVQTSYSFVDSDGNVIFPTSHGHVVIARTTDDDGNVLKVFEKLMDVDVVSEAVKVLGEDIDKNLLSIVYDYEGNLWFVSGGFRKNPQYSQDGFMGYLSRDYIDSALNGEKLKVSEHLAFIRLTEGEGAENGISSCPDGVVILTNKSCYLTTGKENNVEIKWKIDYESVPKETQEGSDITGIGLAWGGGSTPTLTNDLVLFTDNRSPVHLMAISIKTGELVASMPVLDSLPETTPVSVENSILVYAPSDERASVIICNWFGAGNSGLDSPDANSSIQSYENIYDANWMKEGNKYLSPGIERIDVVKIGDSYHMEKVWTREDIRDTSMLKLSTATGYLYGYWQNIDTGFWSYYILDYTTGETLLEVPVSDNPLYNNMAVGMIVDIRGNALYCPTNAKVLLRLQDRFVYLPGNPEIKLNLDETSRENLSCEEFAKLSGTEGTPISYLSAAAFYSVADEDVIAFRVNGINNKNAGDLSLYAMDDGGSLKQVEDDAWQIKNEAGEMIKATDVLVPENIYEIHFNVTDQNSFDLCEEEGKLKVSIVLVDKTDRYKTSFYGELNGKQKEATEYTVDINKGYYEKLDFNDNTEYECAIKGLIDAPETLTLTDETGKVVWSQDAFDFINYSQEAPDSVNPGLWRNAALNHQYGLFEVTEGIYQVRGYDMSNLTVIETDTGWIVFDTLMSEECSAAAMQLIEKNLGKRPIKAIFISHSHVDHYGGIKGIVRDEDVADATLPLDEQIASGKVPVIVPEGFMEHAVAENVYVGNAMSVRSKYQYGAQLEKNIQGAISVGIGMGQSTGQVTFIVPTFEITYTGEKLNIDGLEIEFQLTPGTEAPSEMNAYFPKYKALWMAENCTATLHNLYTLRGAQVRDGNAWAKYINEAKTRYGDRTEIVFQSHNWPHFGREQIDDYLTNTAAVYKFINDRTLMYINDGYTSDEISNMIELPQALEKVWYIRQYYGTVAHNSKAVYQKYMGWYDANPVNLNPLSPSESAAKWVEYLGDVDKVIKMAQNDFENGEYQWVAEVMNTVVFADPDNLQARYLCADALEQLGYQAESGPWRNAYLMAAVELRNGTLNDISKRGTPSVDLRTSMTPEMMLDYLGILISTEKSENIDFKVNLYLKDLNESYLLHFYNGVLLFYEGEIDEKAEATFICNKKDLFYIIKKDRDAAQSTISVKGDQEVLKRVIDMVGVNNVSFNIIEP